MLLVVVAMSTRTRAGVHRDIAFLVFCSFPLLYYNIPESCRWLVSNNKINKAKEIVMVRTFFALLIQRSDEFYYLSLLALKTPKLLF